MANKPLLDKDLKKILNSDAFTIKLEDKILNFNSYSEFFTKKSSHFCEDFL